MTQTLTDAEHDAYRLVYLAARTMIELPPDNPEEDLALHVRLEAAVRLCEQIQITGLQVDQAIRTAPDDDHFAASLLVATREQLMHECLRARGEVAGYQEGFHVLVHRQTEAEGQARFATDESNRLRGEIVELNTQMTALVQRLTERTMESERRLVAFKDAANIALSWAGHNAGMKSAADDCDRILDLQKEIIGHVDA